ncbi:HPP family protein [Paenibacillus aceris]|uniref:CBS-domain-containing membrane protein n=1 Tax=Paenibacillus aceris TaxID=869555 RepID=A0ABS4I7P9_9BACL|nr:HPP family protein [Paenibacillus aceris]MBP1966885.1 CBS-domain-containing membrane protein [Paenibacillus aceris]NHW38957.1 HPP family protein [Paenibacillus aceris]
MQLRSIIKSKPAAKQLARFIPGIGGFLAILLCSTAGELVHAPLLMAPLGASCVIAFVLPQSPLAQPRSLIGGHLLSTLIGLCALAAFGVHAWSLALAVGAAITLMQLTRTLHPPAGADPLLVMLTGASWGFLLTPVLLGAALLVLVALGYHRATGTRYPTAWW